MRHQAGLDRGHQAGEVAPLGGVHVDGTADQADAVHDGDGVELLVAVLGTHGYAVICQPPTMAVVAAMAAPAEKPAYGRPAETSSLIASYDGASEAWYSGVGPPPTNNPSMSSSDGGVEGLALCHPLDHQLVALDQPEGVDVLLVVLQRLVVRAHHDERDARQSPAGARSRCADEAAEHVRGALVGPAATDQEDVHAARLEGGRRPRREEPRVRYV